MKNRIKEGLLLGGGGLQHVERFKYLGTTLTANCDCSTDIRIRTATALKVMSDLNNNIKNETKMRPKHGHLGVLKRNNYLYLRWQHLNVIDKMRNHDIRKALNQTRSSKMYMIPDNTSGLDMYFAWIQTGLKISHCMEEWKVP